MNITEKVRGKFRNMKLRSVLRGEDHSAEQLERATDMVLGWAHSDLAAGVRKDRVLFDFESTFEEISDEIARLADRGEMEAYRDIYAKLYRFAEEMMADSYMPLYLYILYRYANALLKTGEPEEAVKLFEELCAGTDRLIGIRNSYGIHCLERLAVAAAESGQTQKASGALEDMEEIAANEFGDRSAMMKAVRRFSGRMRAKIG